MTSTIPESNHRRKKWEGLVCIGVLFWVIMAPMDMAFGQYDEGYKLPLVLGILCIWYLNAFTVLFFRSLFDGFST
jgi:hypothetical protein